MVDAITGFVVGKIGGYLIEEASTVMGVKDDLEELKTELTCIQGYLKDVEAREREDEVSKEWTKLVLDIAYDVEDVLDSYIPKLEERSQRRGLMRLTNKISEKMDAYSIVDDIRMLKRRILDITRKRETYGIGNFNESGGGGGGISTLRASQLRRSRSVDYDELVVGLADDAKILSAKLLNDDDNKRYMISIFGMGGLGKTALARKLYNLGEAKRRFEYRAWTYVSQEYKTRDILMRIIRSLGITSGEELERIKVFAEEELEVYLHDLLEDKRYLVVVDDIWERDAWDSLKRALPCNHKGSRVIITTRIRAVAEGVDRRVYAHKLRFLTFKESWKLFEQKAGRNIQWVDEDLQKIGKGMIQKCGGLPLAVVVLSGLLSRKRPSEWNEVCASLWRCLKEDNFIRVSTVFDLSFKELRHELKLCFLYLSVFPEDYGIDVEKLIHLLVAEGFIREDKKMMEDVARCYIEELIDRNLVEAVRIEGGKVISCRVHGLLREMVINKAKELNFVNVYNDQHSSTTCRREVVHHLMNDQLCDRRANKRMRSFMFFGEQKGMLENNYVETKTLKLKLLRVLNLGGIRFVCKGEIHLSLPDVIGDLIHLRYLGVADTFIRNLPAFISNLKFLQTLDTSGNDLFQGTTDLSKLTSLRHVIGKFVGELLIGDAVNLQTLRSISSWSWNKINKYELLKNLRELEIYDESEWADQRSVPLSLASFSKLVNLRVLKLEVNTLELSSSGSEEKVGFVGVNFPSLESLTFVGTNLKEDPMPALQKLPKLEDLVLKDCACREMEMSIGPQGFARLRKLELIMVRLDMFQIEEEAMPSLIDLNVKANSSGMKLTIPDRLRAFVRGYAYRFFPY